MHRRTYLQTVATAATASTVGLAGCSAMTGTATGTLATRVSDQPGDIAAFAPATRRRLNGLVAVGGEITDRLRRQPEPPRLSPCTY
jgi:hypothetical protein